MKIIRVKGSLVLSSFSLAMIVGIGVGNAQVIGNDLVPPANTNMSHQSASIARDSGINRPLSLLNDFYPAVEVTISDHDNVRRRPDFDEDDLKVVVQPSLAYRTSLGRQQFYAAYNGTYTFHQDIDQENSESNNLTAKLGLDLTRRWDLEVFGAIGESFEQRGVSGSREFLSFQNRGINSGPEEFDYQRYGADLIFGRKIGILSAVLGYEYAQSGYQSDDLVTPLLDGSRDRSSESVHFDLNWKFASKTSVFGRVERSETRYDNINTDIDSDQTDFLIGLRFAPASSLSGVVGVGRSDKDFVAPNREGYDDNSYFVNLNYAINPLSNISLAASRVVEEPNDEFSSFYESELFGVSWTHSLTDQLIFDAYAKLIDDDYDTDREDQFVDWGLGLDYVWRSWLTAGIYYGQVERKSTIGEIEYDDSYFGIRLRSDLRSLLKGRGKKMLEPSSFGELKKSSKTQ